MTFQTQKENRRLFDMLIDGEVYGAAHSSFIRLAQTSKFVVDKLIEAGVLK